MEKEIQDWKLKIQQQFQAPEALMEFMLHTLEQFAHRYLETTSETNLKPQFNSQQIRLISHEPQLAEILKNKNPQLQEGVKNMAKKFLPQTKPWIQNALTIDILKLTPTQGQLKISTHISWDFPDFSDHSQAISRHIEFSYQDLASFRKNFALKLEEVCELFL